VINIWDSTGLMTAIDLAIVSSVLFAVWSIRSRRRYFRRLGFNGPATVSAGLLLLAVLFVADLVIMWGLPLFTSGERAHAVMSDLHLNWSWLVILVSAMTLSAGLVSTVRELGRAESELDRGETLFRDIVGSQTEFIVRWKPDGTRTFVNEAYCQYFRQPAEALIGTSFMPLVAPEHREMIRHKIESLTPERPTAVETHRVIREDGSDGWQEWSDTGFFDENGTLVVLQSVGRDVSERRLAALALEESEKRYRAVFDATTCGFVIRRLRDGKLVDLNPAMAGFHGYSREEMLAMPMEQYVPTESLVRFEKALETLRRGKRIALEGRGVQKNGELFDLEGFFVPFEHLSEPHTLGVLDDVTTRNRAARAIRASEEKFSKAFESSPGSIAITSLTDDKILEVNSRFVEQAGLSREEIVGNTIEKLGLWRDPELRARLLEGWRRGEELGPHEVALRTTKGEDRIVELSAAVFEADGEPRLLTAGRDITDRRLAEEDLRDRLRVEGLISDLSAQFINVEASQLDAEIEKAIRLLGEGLGLSRSSLFQRETDDSWPLTHVWALPGLERFDKLNLADFAWMFERMKQGRSLVNTRLADLPEEARAERRWSREYGTSSPITILPLEVAGRVLGAVTFRLAEGERDWSQSILQRLRLVADILANALARRQADEAGRASEERYRTSFEETARLKQELERERDYLREEVTITGRFGEIVGDSAALVQVMARVEAVASTDASVLIQGETGVGKELVARAIHAGSERSSGPLVRVNCPAVPRELFESEFFGHAQGAFTGAHRDRIGRFELADGGTIFLDEVSEIPLDLQAKLLRVLQEGEFQRVGEETTRTANVRVLAATNRGLKLEALAGRFREDLYYRLSVFPIEVPALRDRREDILPLVHHFLARACEQLRRPKLSISEFQGQQILSYDWPGNVRELQNVIEQAAILSKGKRLRLDLALPGAPRAEAVQIVEPQTPRHSFLTAAEFKRRERDNLIAALERAAWKISGTGGAAELLGVKPSTLTYQIKALGIEKPQASLGRRGGGQ